MRTLQLALLFPVAACGGSTALERPEGGPPGDGARDEAATPLLSEARCDPPCDGQVDIISVGGQSERPDGGTLEITLRLANCGRGTARAGVRLVLQGRDESGVIEVLDSAATTQAIPSSMAEAVTVTAAWERWSRYINSQELCLEIVLDAGGIEDCSVTGDWAWYRDDVEGCCDCLGG